MDTAELIKIAETAGNNAYAPYSGFKVGAALLCKDGTVFTGCNIENASYGLCNCAERTAFFKAISEGHKEFTAIAIIGSNDREICYPCGACRQVMNEFCNPSEFKVIAAATSDLYEETVLENLLPNGFGPQNMK